MDGKLMSASIKNIMPNMDLTAIIKMSHSPKQEMMMKLKLRMNHKFKQMNKKLLPKMPTLVKEMTKNLWLPLGKPRSI